MTHNPVPFCTIYRKTTVIQKPMPQTPPDPSQAPSRTSDNHVTDENRAPNPLIAVGVGIVIIIIFLIAIVFVVSPAFTS